MPMTDIAQVARLEEARAARAVSEIADEWVPCAGGTMSRSVPGSWLNCVVGAGMAGPVTSADVAAIVDYYAPRAIEPRVELCPLADPSFISALEAAGFVLRSFENVLFREIVPGESFPTLQPAPPGLVIQQVNPADAAAVREYVLTAMSGFIPPGTPLPDGLIESAERSARHPRSVALVARLPDEAGSTAVAAGGMEAATEVAALYGVSVREPYRRRGIQQALLAHRLRLAAARGCTVATIGSRPGAHTERNVRRMGFNVAYTKPVLVKPGPGLVAVIGG